jgi:hypothetical protein
MFTKPLTMEPCPAYGSHAHAAAVIGHAAAWLLTEQMNACPNRAEPMEFAPVGTTEHGPDAAELAEFSRSLLTLMHIAWTNLTYKHYMPTATHESVVKGALVLPFWAAAMPGIGEAAARHRIPLLAAMWHGFDFDYLPATPSGVVLAVISNNHMAPSLAVQNYTVESVHPFTTKAAA